MDQHPQSKKMLAILLWVFFSFLFDQHGWSPPIRNYPSGISIHHFFYYLTSSNRILIALRILITLIRCSFCGEKVMNLFLMFLTWWFWCWLQRDAIYTNGERKGNVLRRVNGEDASKRYVNMGGFLKLGYSPLSGNHHIHAFWEALEGYPFSWVVHPK